MSDKLRYTRKHTKLMQNTKGDAFLIADMIQAIEDGNKLQELFIYPMLLTNYLPSETGKAS